MSDIEYGGVDPGESQARRASHRKNSPELLRAAGVPFTATTGANVHLVVGMPALFDFWPGTGLWILRRGVPNRRGRGVKSLIAMYRNISKQMNAVPRG